MAVSSVHGLEGRCLAGRYELREPIGSGGMASVWLAHDTRLDRAVAVKLLSEDLAHDPTFIARFHREATVAASLAHPNLVRIFDFDADHDPPFLVMEHVPGPDLAARMSARQSIDVERLADDLLAALEAIHRAGVLHRDVKPHNVLLAPGGRAKLTDFGIARRQDATSLTQTGQVPGTAGYMAPELFQGEPPTPSSDLYSCGVVLRDCLSTQAAGEVVGSLAERLCQPDPSRRPASAANARADLGARESGAPIAPGLAGSARRLERSTAASRPPEAVTKARAAAPPASEPVAWAPRRSARLPALAGLVAVAAGVGVLVIFSGDDGAPRSDRVLRSARNAGSEEPPATTDGGSAGGEGSGSSDTAAAGATSSPADPEAGAALNDQGFRLLQAGESERAVPILRRAVASFPEGTDDINYAYALYNLGHALRLSGHPREAIPVLRERLGYPDQADVVRSELDAALAAAGSG